MKNFCFLDIETTGLDPDKDSILEIAWIFTDEAFSPMSIASFLIDHDELGWADVWNRINDNDFIKKMHTESGLLSQLANPDAKKHSLDYVFDVLEDCIRRESVFGLVHLAGRSVHFDKSFLLANDFGVLFDDSQPVSFHHRMLDLTSVKLMLGSAGVDAEAFQGEALHAPHRALNDVKNDVNLARNLRIHLEGASL